MSEAVRVDIWSDVACPFCYIGKQKFEAGVAAAGVDVEIEYHSFELAPETPDEVTATHAEHLMHRMGVSLDEAHELEARTISAAHEVGLDINYDILKQSNTRRAHQVLHYAKARGAHSVLLHRLMVAYFAEGRSMANVEDLVDLAVEVGLDGKEVAGVLERNEHQDEVVADRRLAAENGIRSVPFFVIAKKYAVSGAQDPAVFAQALSQARAEQMAP